MVGISVNFDLSKYQVKEIKPLPLRKRRGKPTKLEMLGVGERFEVVGLEEAFRGLYVAATSECAITIRGFQRREDEWVSLGSNYSISTTTKVRPL